MGIPLLFGPASGGGTTYNKTGSLVAGTRVAGTATFTASVTGSEIAGTRLAGVAVKILPNEHIKAGSLIAGTRVAGVDSFTGTRTGTVVAGTRFLGADVVNFTEAGSLNVGTQTSGTKFIEGSGNTYVRTGSIVSGTRVSAESVHATPTIYEKTGSFLVGTNVVGVAEGGTPVIEGRPIVCPAAEELYEILKPLAYADEEHDWALLKYCAAIACPVQVVKDYGADWSQILSVDEAPHDALPWLAQMVGSVVDAEHTGETHEEHDARARDYIRATPGFNRGTREAMTAAIQQHLTGTKTVIIRERQGGAYKLQIRTKAAETPSEDLVLQSISWQKPAGLTLDYDTLAGQDYDQVHTDFATYQDVYEEYATYNGLYLDLPGT